MPRMVGVSSCSTAWCMRRRPRAFTVASCVGERPMRDLVSVILSFLPGTGRLLHATVDDALAPRGVQILKPLDATERVDGRLQHVVRIVRAERLGEDVLDADSLEHGPYGAARDDTRPRHRGLQEHAPAPEVPGGLDGNRRLAQGNEDQILLRVLDRLADGLRHLVSLAETDPDVATPVAHDPPPRYREAPAALA